MPQPSSISRRIQSCINYANAGNYESAMVNFFPALDKTAKRRRPKAGVGDRIRSFISDQEAIITAIATGNILQNISINGVSFPEAIYKFGRTPIAHEGELGPRLTFNNGSTLQIGNTWNLPSSYITGLCVGVMVAPENSQGFIDPQLSLTIFGHRFGINELWGAEREVKRVIADAFRNPNLFG
ncbi:MAG TPA: hypothetical protein VFQ94_01475 [Gallionella sp.]|nr:hypothetical protein [Gallionella sp.]